MCAVPIILILKGIKRVHAVFQAFISSQGNFVVFVFYLNVYSIELTFRIEILLPIKKHFVHFLLVSKIIKSLHCILEAI